MSSKRCAVCKKPGDLAELFEGLYDNQMIMVCEPCAAEEKIPILRKPSVEQLNVVEHRPSVRERMERISGMQGRNSRSTELAVHGHMNRLRQPAPKQQHEDVHENYYWTLRMARRRQKLTLTQAAERTRVAADVIDAVEKGKIPRDFAEVFSKLEDYFEITMLKRRGQKVNFVMPQVPPEKILEDVKERMRTSRQASSEPAKKQITPEAYTKAQALKDIGDGDFDFSDKKKVENLTLHDLARLKKQKEAKKKELEKQQQTDDLLGDDIEIEWDN